MLLRSLFLLIFVFLVVGCTTTKSYTNIATNNYIKGIVTSISKVNSGYVYTIESTDTSNGKLTSAQGFSSKPCNVGDLVYARLNGAKFDYFAVLVTGFERVQEPAIIKKHHRTKQNLTTDNIPIVENIEF
ncbi:hypothetical protein [Campylobacter vicugnae]|uniref:hypothetical protein n=1 Tax=Campylobacter vicugnae TaxID=1660076 RepID=UPI00254E1A95|nr:hypothetical protein [Campylobacter ovis]MDL0104540.1 hypothetical protein [Campylobacter ovis]MDL0106281.1 hypothetical protein [Campylobacter ovis]